MASTNKTSGFSLSQFIGTDKPSWLGDYNGDMLKIDTGMLDIKATAEQGNSTATSAASAAAAAQQTANSAQNLANSNKQDIDNLETALTNQVLEVDPLGNATSGAMIVAYSDYIQRFTLSIYWSDLPNNSVVSGTNTLVPIYSVPNNIFKIKTSTINDEDNKVYIGNFVLVADTSDKEYITDSASIRAYFDGANTIFYLTKGTTTYSQYTRIRYIFGNATTLFAGKFMAFPV